jgi:carbonic anhydrase
MDKLIKGIREFQQLVYPEHKLRFEMLAETQEPDTLFITCSDSRIDPNLITQSAPGELFICRNAGNIVPPHSNETGGMTASIEYAVSVLNVKQIVICGHSHCGAIKAVMEPDKLSRLPHVKEWIGHARAAKETIEQKHSCLHEEHLQEVTKQNIVLQLMHLKTHPAVFARLANNDIKIYGWMYDIKTGQVEYYDEEKKSFFPFI